MTGLELIGSPQSVYVRAVRLALHEKSLDYVLTSAAPHSPTVTTIHPFGRIPVLRHLERRLCESRAIVGYLDDAFDGPRLMPFEPYERAQAEQWASLLSTEIMPTLTQFTRRHYFPEIEGKGECGTLQLFDDVLRRLDLLEERLTGRPFLAGPGLTFADMLLMPILAYLLIIPSSARAIEQRHNLRGYFYRLSRRKSWAETEPPPMAELGAALPA